MLGITFSFAPFQYNVQKAEQGIEESNAYEEMTFFSEEDADESDEIQCSKNISEKAAKLMVSHMIQTLSQSLPFEIRTSRDWTEKMAR